MLSVVYQSPWQISLEDRPEPDKLEKGEVLIRIRATGVCGTDLGIISGLYHAKKSTILGHESSGDVVRVGEGVTTVKPGDRVAIDPTFYCGMCKMCRTNRSNHCELKGKTETGVTRDGTFAKYYVTEERFLYKLADHVTYEEATFTEPLSCVLTGLNQVHPHPTARTLVLGAGPMGMLYSHALRSKGVTGGLVEISEERLRIAQEIAPNQWGVYSSLSEAIQHISPEDGQVDLIVDTTSVLASTCIPKLARGGTLLLVGLKKDTATFCPSDVADRSLKIIGSIDSLGTFATSHTLIEKGIIPVKKLITHHFPLSQFPEAIKELGCNLDKQELKTSASAMKIVIHP